MVECAFKSCIYHGSLKTEDFEEVTYHPFPKNPVLREKWIKQMNQDDFHPVATSMLCSRHFIKEYFLVDARGTTHLKADAIPTEFEFELPMDDNEDDTIRCCAYKCGNTYNEESPITFHPFPLDQPELCDQWLLAMNVTQVAAKQAVLCSEHFDESSFVQGDNGERLIIADAVPSIFLYPDETENSEGVDMSVSLHSDAENGGMKFEMTETSVDLVQKHDETVTMINEESHRLIEMTKERIKLEKEKKDMDFLLRAVVNGRISDKDRLRDLKALIKNVDEVVQTIVVDCLAPCIALAADNKHMQEQE